MTEYTHQGNSVAAAPLLKIWRCLRFEKVRRVFFTFTKEYVKRYFYFFLVREERNQLISQLTTAFCDCMYQVIQFQNYILYVICDQIITDEKYDLFTGLSHNIYLEKL